MPGDFRQSRSKIIINAQTIPAAFALWRAVLHRALCDACYQWLDEYQINKHSFARKGTQHISRETHILAQQARSFLLQDFFRFNAICHLAGIEPSQLRRRTREVISDVDQRIRVGFPSTKAERGMALA